MSEIMCIVLAFLLGFAFWWARLEIRNLRDGLRLVQCTASDAQSAASKADRRALEVELDLCYWPKVDGRRTSPASLEDVCALAEAAGFERIVQKSGWRKKAK